MEEMISVVIPNYNRGKTISLALESVFSSTYKNYEVIVVDGGSTDNSIEIIRKFDCKLVELNREEDKHSRALNAGVEISKGNILLFIDTDSCLPRDALEKINDMFNREKDISVIVGMPDAFCKFKNIASQHFNLRIHFNYLHMPDYISTLYGSVCAIRREAFFDVGGFDANLTESDDNDLGYRLSDRGYKIKLNKNIQINHYKHITFLKLLKNDFKRASARIKLMIRRRKFKQTFAEKRFISTPIAQIYSVMVTPFIFSAVIGSFFSIYSVFFMLFFLLLFYFFNKNYLSFLKRQKGLLFSVLIYFLLLIDMSVVGFGIFSGLVSYVRGQTYH